MARSDNTSPPPVDPADQLAELRRKRDEQPPRPSGSRSRRSSRPSPDRNRSDGGGGLHPDDLLDAGLFRNATDDLDATSEEPPAQTATATMEDVDTQLEAAVARAHEQ